MLEPWFSYTMSAWIALMILIPSKTLSYILLGNPEAKTIQLLDFFSWLQPWISETPKK